MNREMPLKEKDLKEVLYFQITDLWRRLCEEHSTLFDLTCDEYSLLLKSDLDLIEAKTAEKEEVITRINLLERMRAEIIENLDKHAGKKFESISELINYMSDLSFEKEQKHLMRFNALLLDIIEKIQAQNKKNQMFINKAILSLRELRQDALGNKNYSTYNSKGSTRLHTGG